VKKDVGYAVCYSAGEAAMPENGVISGLIAVFPPLTEKKMPVRQFSEAKISWSVGCFPP
jgi:hypothetical protein